MNPEERASVVERLHLSRDIFLDAVAGLSAAQAMYHPRPDSWSIEQIAEHVAVSEHEMFRLITSQYANLDEPASSENEVGVRERALDRSIRIECPEECRPMGRFASFVDSSRVARVMTIAKDSSIVYPGASGSAIARHGPNVAAPMLGDGLTRLGNAWAEQRLDRGDQSIEGNLDGLARGNIDATTFHRKLVYAQVSHRCGPVTRRCCITKKTVEKTKPIA